MKRVIASRAGDVRRKIEEYNRSVDDYVDRRRIGSDNYREALKKYNAVIKDDIIRSLRQISPSLDIAVEIGKVRAVVQGGRNNDNILTWSLRVEFQDDRSVELETNSYSGLNAIDYSTDQLRQIADALDYLIHDFDWGKVFDDAPRYEDYQTVTEDERPSNQDYMLELQDAIFEDMIGTDLVLKIPNWYDSKVQRGQYAYISVVGETPKFWKVRMASSWVVDETSSDSSQAIFDRIAVSARLRKDTLYIMKNDNQPVRLKQ